MASRLSGVTVRMQTLNAITDDNHPRVPLKADIDRLRRRARLLNSGILASLRGGLCATLLLAILFVSEFFWPKVRLRRWLAVRDCHALVDFALFRFAQEAQISLGEADEYR